MRPFEAQSIMLSFCVPMKRCWGFTHHVLSHLWSTCSPDVKSNPKNRRATTRWMLCVLPRNWVVGYLVVLRAGQIQQPVVSSRTTSSIEYLRCGVIMEVLRGQSQDSLRHVCSLPPQGDLWQPPFGPGRPRIVRTKLIGGQLIRRTAKPPSCHATRGHHPAPTWEDRWGNRVTFGTNSSFS